MPKYYAEEINYRSWLHIPTGDVFTWLPSANCWLWSSKTGKRYVSLHDFGVMFENANSNKWELLVDGSC